MHDTLVYPGGACKALDDAGKVGGYLVVFGDAENTDLSSFRDYFTKDTDFGLDDFDRSVVLYHHGLDPVLAGRKLGTASLKMTDAGIWMEAQLKLRDDYERRVWDMVKAGKCGLSSGTASHRIRRSRQPNGAHKIEEWPLGLDASITPTPAEPRTAALAIKSLADLMGDDAPGLRLADHLESVRAAASGLRDRWQSYADMRAKDGRKVSSARLDGLKSVISELEQLVRAAEPEPESFDGDDLYRDFLDLESRVSHILD